jgi:hypothetical protein
MRAQLTERQRAVLDSINERAEWRDADGSGFGDIAFEVATGDPVVYVYDEHEAFVLRPDGALEISPEPEEKR